MNVCPAFSVYIVICLNIYSFLVCVYVKVCTCKDMKITHNCVSYDVVSSCVFDFFLTKKINKMKDQCDSLVNGLKHRDGDGLSR